MDALMPLFLKLSGRRVLLVGGGNIALQKLRALEGTGADIVVVAPQFHPEVAAAAGIRRYQRPVEEADLDGAWLVISAAPHPVNAEVTLWAERRHIFTVAVDHPEVGSAYAGGLVRKGDVTVAISTAGRAPALAGLLREALEAVLPDDVQRWVDLASELRMKQRADGVPMAERRPLLLAALQRLYVKGPLA